MAIITCRYCRPLVLKEGEVAFPIEFVPPLPTPHPSSVFVPVSALTRAALEATRCQICNYTAAAIEHLAPGWIEDESGDELEALKLHWVRWAEGRLECGLIARPGLPDAATEPEVLRRFFHSPHLLIELTSQSETDPAIPGLVASSLPIKSSLSRACHDAFVSEQVSRCLSSHDCCKQRSTAEDGLPKRLIHLLDGSVYLVNVNEGEALGLDYAALSYCWGHEATGFKLLTGSAAALRSGIPRQDFSIVFQNFWEVIESVGIHYAWIDALCIQQDDRQDWEYHSAIMGGIYSHSMLTVAAVSSSGPSVPFLGPEAPRTDEEFISLGPVCSVLQKSAPRIYAQLRYPVEDQYEYEGPLDTRGWTLQENMLSRRCLRYTSNGLRWSCLQSFVTEAQPQVTNIPCRPQSYYASESASLWRNVVVNYSRRKFTVNSDRLPALSGLASFWKRFFGAGGYLAGLWEENVIEDLLWFRIPTCSLQDVVSHPTMAPSFSWASINGAVSFGRKVYASEAPVFLSRVVEISCKPATSNPFGPVTNDSFIRLEAPVLQLWMCGLLEAVNVHDSDPPKCLFHLENIDLHISGVLKSGLFIDCALGVRDNHWIRASSPPDKHWYDGSYRLVTLAFCIKKPMWEMLAYIELLVLSPSATTPGSFQRIGLYYIHCEGESLAGIDNLLSRLGTTEIVIE